VITFGDDKIIDFDAEDCMIAESVSILSGNKKVGESSLVVMPIIIGIA
jgi:hypothetical protein